MLMFSLCQSVLELEAAVQRNATDPRAWYELGVKQQENEREHKALQALQRAVHLDPTYLSAWLALAVSHANNNNRQGTFDAISCWVGQNGKHKSAVEKFNALHPADFQDTLSQRCSRLIQCLISLVTSDTTGEVDPDIQIALAILLNTNEEYDKAQDCFRTALAVRPDVSGQRMGSVRLIDTLLRTGCCTIELEQLWPTVAEQSTL